MLHILPLEVPYCNLCNKHFRGVCTFLAVSTTKLNKYYVTLCYDENVKWSCPNIPTVKKRTKHKTLTLATQVIFTVAKSLDPPS